MKLGRIVELSHRMVPGKEIFKLEVHNFPVEELLPQIRRREDLWYIMSDVTMSSHAGTHIEFPFHHLRDGTDAADFPVERLIGDAVLLDLSGVPSQEAIPKTALEVQAEVIHEHDIVIVRTGLDRLFHTDRWMEQPYLAPDALEWLIEEKKMRCLGTDAAGLDNLGTDHQPNHMMLFQHGVPLIESMTNLSQLAHQRFQIFILPLPIEGLDACPVRIVAIEPNTGEGDQ